MGIEEDIKEIKERSEANMGFLSVILNKLNAIEDKIVNKVTEPEKKEDEKKPELNSNEPILFECTNCGVSFCKGEEHVCKK